MKEMNIDVLDLYSIMQGQDDSLWSDGVHYTEDGYERVARAVVNKINEVIESV